MNCLKFDNLFVSEVAEDISKENYSFIPGERLANFLSVDDGVVLGFQRHWDELVRDCYMEDGGQYRYRRYGKFSKLAHQREFVKAPHAPYVQSSSVNSLNGDVERIFEPLSDDFIACPLLIDLLMWLADVYDLVEKVPKNWSVCLHPYRIVANEMEAGDPTPEGLHRDGVTFIASLMVCRNNVSGGVTKVTDQDKVLLEEMVLSSPLDIVLADDEKTMHQVSSVKPLNLEDAAYRDVLVIAFTREE
ncbi:2OG-Fe dioxygenase family protein [Halomonas sp. LY9]